MTSQLFRLYDRQPSQGDFGSGYRYGMNTVDADPTSLRTGQCQLLENAIPGVPVIPCSGVDEVFCGKTHSGKDGNPAIWVGKPEVMQGQDNHRYMFAWSRTNTAELFDTFQLEEIDLTDGSRRNIVQAKFTSSDVHFGFLKLHGCLYCTVDKEIDTNYTNVYLKKNMIVFWDSASEQWAVRAMGIESAPAISSIEVAEMAATNIWSGRKRFATASTGGEAFVVGGDTASGKTAEVYKSGDMSTWTVEAAQGREWVVDESGVQVIDESGENVYHIVDFPARSGAVAIEFLSRLYLLGGETDSGVDDTVWYRASEGVWIREKLSGGFGIRKDFSAVVFSGKLWVFGGNSGSSDLATVWNTTDGITWTEVTQVAGFTARYGHASVVFGSKMWIVAGQGKTNVYSSTDGATWTQTTADAGVGSRYFHGLLSYNGKMWIVAGLTGAGAQDSVYSSADGITWTLVTASGGFTSRYSHGVALLGSKIWLFGGYTGSVYLNTVFKSTDGVTWSLNDGGLTKNKYFSNAFTWVRREDALGKLSAIGDYNFEAWETYNGRTITGIDEKLLTGTVSLSGTALTGSETAFSSQLSVGDNIRIDGTYFCYEVTGITNDTGATVSNTLGHSYSGKGFALLPAIGQAISTSNFNEGTLESVEEISYRQTTLISTTGDFGRQLITIPNVTAAIALGATHLRHYRTLAATTETAAEGLVHAFCYDVAIAGDSFDSAKLYRDVTTDAAMQGESNFLNVAGFTVPLLGRFPVFAGDRLWISGGNGDWYYSSIPLNYQFPQKFASWFALDTQKKVCSPDDGEVNNGTFLLRNDLYFAKERKLFTLYNSDVSNTPQLVDGVIGVACPNTLTQRDIPGLGLVAFWISDFGPTVMSPGSAPTVFESFTVEEVWPGGEVLTTSLGTPTSKYDREKVFAQWHESYLILTYGDSEDVSTELSLYTGKMICFYSSPRGKEDGFGPFKRTFRQHNSTTIFEPQAIISVDNNTAYALSHKRGASSAARYRVALVMKNGQWCDSFDEGDLPIDVAAKSVAVVANRGKEDLIAELVSVWLHGNFPGNSGLAISIGSMRFAADKVYAGAAETQLDPASYAHIRQHLEAFVKEGFYGYAFWAKVTQEVSAETAFYFKGFDFNVLPVYNMDSEFIITAGDRQEDWA